MQVGRAPRTHTLYLNTKYKIECNLSSSPSLHAVPLLDSRSSPVCSAINKIIKQKKKNIEIIFM